MSGNCPKCGAPAILVSYDTPGWAEYECGTHGGGGFPLVYGSRTCLEAQVARKDRALRRLAKYKPVCGTCPAFRECQTAGTLDREVCLAARIRWAEAEADKEEVPHE